MSLCVCVRLHTWVIPCDFSFSVWFISLSTTPFRSIHVVTNDHISFFFKAEEYSSVGTHHIFLARSPVDGHLVASVHWLLWIILRWTQECRHLFTMMVLLGHWWRLLYIRCLLCAWYCGKSFVGIDSFNLTATLCCRYVTYILEMREQKLK